MGKDWKKNAERLKSPYVFAWAVLSPIVTLLSPPDWLREVILVAILGFVIIVWLLVRFTEKKPPSSASDQAALVQAGIVSISRAAKYLEEAENRSDGDVRLRVTKSVMESATVLGALAVASRITKGPNTYSISAVSWVFEVLKEQYSLRPRPDQLEGFDCNGCRANNRCNVSYFDHLSHFVYAKGTPLYNSFSEQFKGVARSLADRTQDFGGRTIGWAARLGDSELDPLATATALHLCIVLSEIEQPKALRISQSLMAAQLSNGSWVRPSVAAEYCGGQLDVITTHRCIEVLALVTGTFDSAPMAIRANAAISRGKDYLLAAPLSDDPVLYERQSGIFTPEKYRALGHVIQGVVKSGLTDSQALREKVNVLLRSQQEDGSFRTSSSINSLDRTLLHYTDITAFAIRTLAFYVEAARNDPRPLAHLAIRVGN